MFLIMRTTFKKHVDLLLLEEQKPKGTMFLLKIFLWDHILYGERKHFCRYCLQAFSAKEILKYHILIIALKLMVNK